MHLAVFFAYEKLTSCLLIYLVPCFTIMEMVTLYFFILKIREFLETLFGLK